MAQPTVTIYSTPTCHFCHAAKDFFTENHVQFTDLNVATDLEKRKEMVEKSGQLGVPVIDIGGEIVVGFDEPRLRQLLSL
jgi:glutaredoxin-like YruB-family protein